MTFERIGCQHIHLDCVCMIWLTVLVQLQINMQFHRQLAEKTRQKSVLQLTVCMDNCRPKEITHRPVQAHIHCKDSSQANELRRIRWAQNWKIFTRQLNVKLGFGLKFRTSFAMYDHFGTRKLNISWKKKLEMNFYIKKLKFRFKKIE